LRELSIGIFDSGLGGLTVVRELRRLLPFENLIYFGDTGRVPYGTRSQETIARYAREDAAFLLSKNVKLIIAACGTVSSVAPDAMRELPEPFLGVVEPAAAAAVNASKTGKIGVLGTTATVGSRAYERAVAKLSPGARVVSTDCPLFVPLVEAGWIDADDPVTLAVAERYLAGMRAENPDALILGCTHFPLISSILQKIMPGAALIDAGFEPAKAAAALLEKSGLLSERGGPGNADYYVSDKPDGFSRIASLFLGAPVDGHVEQVEAGAFGAQRSGPR
jgi:glutamate racemase